MEMFACLILILAVNWLAAKIFFCPEIEKTLSIPIFFAVSMWYTAPGTIGILIPDVLDYLPWSSLKSPELFYEAFIIETSALAATLKIFLSLRRGGKGRRPPTAPAPTAPMLPTMPRLALLLACLAIALYSAASLDMDYVGRSAKIAAQDGLNASTIGKYLDFLAQLALVASLLIYVEEDNRSIRTVAIAGITLYSLIIFIGGMRLIIILPTACYFIRYFKTRKGKLSRIMVQTALGVAFVIMVSPLLTLMSALRTSSGNTDISLEMLAEGYKTKALAIVEEYMIKLNSFSPSVFLLENDGPGKAGVTPYIGSALVFVPRTLMPDRPVAGSVDGTYLGHPSRLIPRLAGVRSDSLTVGSTPVYVAMWHFGWPGVPLFVAAELAYLSILNRLLSSSAFPHRMMGLYFLSIPTFHTIFASPDTILMNLMQAALLLGLLKIADALARAGRRRPKPLLASQHY